MRILLTIVLIFAMAVAPAVAASSCVSMIGEEIEAADASVAHDAMEMGGMAAEDCGDMDVGDVPSHDMGCMAACALACPGFYTTADIALTNTSFFILAEYPAPATDLFFAAPPHLDPPPPRL